MLFLIIKGLGSFGVNIANASKTMSKKFACGCSVTKGKDEIVIQGDVQYDLYEIVTTNFKVWFPLFGPRLTV